MPYRGRGRGRRTRPTLRERMHTEMLGRWMSSRPDIPTISDNPFNTITLSWRDTLTKGLKTIYGQDIYKQILYQVSLPSDMPEIIIRAQWVRIWRCDTKGPLKLAIADPFYSESQLTSREDWPGQNHYPNLGYEWPLIISSRPKAVKADDDQSWFMVVGGSNTDSFQYVFHLHVLWRPNTNQFVSLQNTLSTLTLGDSSPFGTF